MSIVRKKLIARKTSVYDVDGKFMCSISMTDRAIALLDNDGWDKGSESWLDYRNRTEGQRQAEAILQLRITEDMVTAYNEKFNL